jgi:hypothetical protein
LTPPGSRPRVRRGATRWQALDEVTSDAAGNARLPTDLPLALTGGLDRGLRFRSGTPDGSPSQESIQCPPPLECSPCGPIGAPWGAIATAVSPDALNGTLREALPGRYEILEVTSAGGGTLSHRWGVGIRYDDGRVAVRPDPP